MKNKELLEAREQYLIEKLNGEIEEAERKLCHKEIMEIHELLNKDAQVENDRKELEYKLKNDKFDKAVDVTGKIVLPVLKGIGIAAFTIGVIKITNEFEKEGYYSTSVGKGIANIPSKMIGILLK